jgi:catechol 2,3-dioxygenase-like lactoylglutathione lyase family enzyme
MDRRLSPRLPIRITRKRSGKYEMHVRGTDFVMFLVSDLARAVEFYRGALGLKCEIESVEYQWAEFDCGNVTLSLKGNALAKGELAGGRIALAVDDARAAYEELKARGVRIEAEPVDSGFCVACELLDPDGNRIILHQRSDGTCGVTLKNA